MDTMNTSIQYLNSNIQHLTFSQNLNLLYSFFIGITYSDGNGGALYMSKSDSFAEIVDCSFINNTVCKELSEGGSIYIDRSEKVIINCSLFDHNSAYYLCSFWLVDFEKQFELILNQVTVSKSYETSAGSHLDIIGGNPLHLLNYNLTHCNLPYYGMNIKYLEEEKHGVISYMLYAECEIADGYFIHDHNPFPNKYFCDRSCFVNNNISNFFTIKTNQDIFPSYFNCDFIFDITIPNFNFHITFQNCYFQPQIGEKGSAIFNITLIEENGILPKYISFRCLEIENQISKRKITHFTYIFHMLFTSLFICYSN